MIVNGTDNDRAMQIAAAGRWAGKSYREIAVDLFGAGSVAAEWGANGWMRAKVRRLLPRTRAASGEGRDPGGPGDP